MSQQPTISKMMTFVKSVMMSDPPVLSGVQKNMFGAGHQAEGPYQPQDAMAEGGHNKPVDNSLASKMFGGMKAAGSAIGTAAKSGYEYGQEKYSAHQQANATAAQEKDLDAIKTQTLDKIDGISQDIVMKSENSLRSLIDLKTKMENDKIMIED